MHSPFFTPIWKWYTKKQQIHRQLCHRSWQPFLYENLHYQNNVLLHNVDLYSVAAYLIHKISIHQHTMTHYWASKLSHQTNTTTMFHKLACNCSCYVDVHRESQPDDVTKPSVLTSDGSTVWLPVGSEVGCKSVSWRCDGSSRKLILAHRSVVSQSTVWLCRMHN